MDVPKSENIAPRAQEAGLAEILTRALKLARDSGSADEAKFVITGSGSVTDAGTMIRDAGVTLGRVLSVAALEAARSRRGGESRATRDSLEFIQADKRPAGALLFTKDPAVSWSLSSDLVLKTAVNANRTIELIEDVSIGNDVPIFPLLGLRNLSSFVGEIFARELQRLLKDRLQPNPNQDGYPDLLALTPEGAQYVRERERRGETSEKRFWSPYPYGGVEVKATCGNTIPARIKPKPKIGEARLPTLASADWKAHHRDTNNLLGIFWDFIDGLPTVIGVFYRADLTVDDWGAIIQPKEGGGRTTSVSIMKKAGVKRMGQAWLVLPKRLDLRKPLCQRKVYSIKDTDIAEVCSAWDPSLTV